MPFSARKDLTPTTLTSTNHPLGVWDCTDYPFDINEVQAALWVELKYSRTLDLQVFHLQTALLSKPAF